MLFSIIIPAYNVKPFILETLASIEVAVRELAKKNGDAQVEVICVDDGSTDGTGAVLDEFAGRSTSSSCTFKVIHQQNKGLSAARNAGLETAVGEYVLFVDGDDLIHPQTLAILWKETRETAIDCVRYGWTREDPAVTGWCDVDAVRLRRFSLDRDGQLDAAMRFVFGGSACTACYRRGAIGEVRFEPLRHNEDHVFNTAVFGRFKTCAQVGASLYYYRVRAGSMTKSVSDEQFDSILHSMQRIHEISRAWPFFAKVRCRVYTYIWRECAGYCYVNTLDVEKRMGRAAREKYLSMVRALYASRSFAPNALTRTLRLLSLHLGPLSWPIGVTIFMYSMLKVKGRLYRSTKALLR